MVRGFFLFLWFSLAVANANACGYCVEDRIAAVYDHQVVTAAQERRHHVAIYAITGALEAHANSRRALEVLIESATGVDNGSAKLSVESTTLAVAFDPRRATIVTLQRAIERRLAEKKLSLQPLRIIDHNGELRGVDVGP